MALKKIEDDQLEVYEEAQSITERLPVKDAYEALKKIKRRYPKNATVDIFLFNALEKLGLKDGAQEYLASAINGWQHLRAEAKDKLVDAYCSNVIKDPTKDYIAEGMLAPSKFVERRVRTRLKERLAANPRDVDALRWMGALTGGAESVFFLRLAVEADKNETFARRRLLKHIAERIAYAVQDLPAKWNGNFEDDMSLLDYAEKMLIDLETADPSEGDYWRKIYDRYNAVARDYVQSRKRKRA